MANIAANNNYANQANQSSKKEWSQHSFIIFTGKLLENIRTCNVFVSITELSV